MTQSCACHSHEHSSEGHGHEHSHDSSSFEKWLLICSSLIYIATLLAEHFIPSSQKYLPLIYLSLYVACGYSVIKEALKLAFKLDFFNEFTLMSVATIVAIIIGQTPEAIGVMLFYRIGEYLQELASKRSRKSIKDLITSKPDVVNLVTKDGIKEISVDEIKVGQSLLVRIGEQIPTDGIILKGFSRVDTSSLTGEFLPVIVNVGDEVLGGYINNGEVITIKVTKEFKDTSVARTMSLIEEASSRKAPTEKFITKFARYYTPAVFLMALMVAIIPPLTMQAEWNTWIYRSLVMLVISCPCALVISIPLSYFASIGVASQKGILIKGGVVVDSAKDVNMVVFDKTGTLTKGELSISKTYPAKTSDKEELMNIAYYTEQYSNHPIAKAILKKINKNPDNKGEAKEVAGKGIIVTRGKDTYFAGNEAFLNENGIEVIKRKDVGTHVYFAKNKTFKGCIVLNDTIKEEAFSTIKSLQKEGIKTFMLSGDNEASANYVATKLGIDDYKSHLLPQEKLDELNKIYHDNKIMFVGDGVNDAPALSSVHIGVAMGGVGSKLAVEVSDVVILNDDISKVYTTIDLGKRTNKIVWQNIVMALGVKTLFMALGVVGLSGLWEAVFADVGVSLLAIFNSLRLLKK